MDKKTALQFLAQTAQDFLNTLPVSAREPFRQVAQQAITALESPSADAPTDKEPARD